MDQESLRLAEEVGRFFPDDPKIRFYRGSLRLALQKIEEGAEDLLFVVDRQPDNLPARLNLARALFQS